MQDQPSAFVPPVRRVAAALGAGVVAWLLLTAAEVTHLDEGSGAAWLSVAGLLGPVVVGVTIAIGAVGWWLEPNAPWGIARLVASTGRSPEKARWLAATAAGVAWASVLVLVTLGGLGTWSLAQTWPWGRGGTLLSGVVLGVGLVGVPSIVWLTHRVKSMGFAVSAGLVFGALLVFGVLILFGETSGAGGVASMWGVFRREELDLTLPGYALLMFVVGYQGSWLLRNLPLWGGVVGVLASFGLWLSSASMTSELALGIEQHAPLTRLALTRYQRSSDDDGDGFAGRFGGGDCDDRAPGVNPDARDVPGNGVDEDCSGKDAVVLAGKAPTNAAPTDAAAVGKAPAGANGESATSPSSTAGAAPSGLPKDANVVLITIDTLRHDLGYTGYQRPVSANIDALAKRAIVYDRAYSLASYTSKSLGPMLIGRYGSETNRGWMHFNKYPAQDRMVQERLASHGVFTLSVQGHWYFKADTGLGRGFDVLDLSGAPERPQGEGDKTVNSAAISDAAIKLIEQPERATQRFFLWAHYLDPHAEYVPHGEFDFGSNGRARYDGEVAFTDHHVGRVLAAIEKAPFNDRTIVIVTSDHGEAFGEHGLIRHGFELWEELVRVPLLVYVPGQAPRHIAERRSAIDIVPTLLDVFGAPPPSGDDALSGQSLLGEWLGGSPSARDIFIDMPAGPYNGDRQAFISSDLKLVTSNGRPMGLFNLASDPGETTNLTKDASLVEPALERMKAFRDRLRVVKVKPQ